MDAEIKQLLINRLKFFEFEGYSSPTMKLLSKSNLNPKIFKLKRLFDKSSLVNKQKDLKINLAEYLKIHLKKRRNLSQVTEKNSDFELKKLYKINQLPSLTRIEYQNLALFRKKKEIRFKCDVVKSGSVEPFRYKVLSKKLKVSHFTPKELKINVQKIEPIFEVSKSLDVSCGKRVVLSKAKKDRVLKEFSTCD